MPDLKISQLPAASTPLAGTELVPIVQGGTTDQTTVQAILTSAVPSGTANGVLYLNGSKVATSGSALTFDGNNLGVGSAAGSNARLFAYANDATLPTLMARQDGAGPMQVWQSAGGAEAMRLTSTGLGIGTSSPEGKLHVVGSSVLVSGSSGEYALLRGRSSDDLGFLAFQSNSGVSTYGYIGVPAANQLAFYTNGFNERMRLDASGNLGLGVTPYSGGTGWKTMDVGNYAAYAQRAAGTQDATMSWNAYIVSGAVSSGTGYQYKRTGDPASAYEQNGAHRWYTAPSGTAGNAISFSQVMTLDASGNLLVGKTSSYSGFRLQVNNGNGYAVENSAGSTQAAWFGAGNDIGLSPGNFAVVNGVSGILFGVNSTERARIPAAGGMVVGTAALATSATDGFLYVPTCAGTPTGTPTTQTGTAPIVVDTTNNKLYFYSGGQWRDAGP